MFECTLYTNIVKAKGLIARLKFNIFSVNLKFFCLKFEDDFSEKIKCLTKSYLHAGSSMSISPL